MTAVEYRVPWSSSGHYPQMSLELPVEPTDRLRQVVAGLVGTLPGFQPFELTALRLTGLHLGRPHELLTELRREELGGNADLTLPALHGGLVRLVNRWAAAAAPWPSEFVATHFGRLGAVLVLRPNWVDAFLEAARRPLWQDLLDMLATDCGISRPAVFAAHSLSLGRSAPGRYWPGVGLGRLTGPLDPLPPLGRPLLVPLGPVRYRGFDQRPAAA